MPAIGREADREKDAEERGFVTLGHSEPRLTPLVGGSGIDHLTLTQFEAWSDKFEAVTDEQPAATN